MNKIRLGVIGTGLAWERLHYPAIQELDGRYEVVALSNRTKSDADDFANKIGLSLENVYVDYKEMLKRDDLDAVDILVPIEQNFEVSADVAQAGKNFICEKPMAPSIEEANRFLTLARKSGLKIMIAENYRYSEENNRIREILQSGRIGNVVYFIRNNITCFPCEMSQDTFAGTEWRQHPQFTGGVFLDAALHDLASLRHIFGAVTCVQALGKPQLQDFNPYLSVHSNIQFRSGVIGQFNYYPSGMEPQKPSVGFRIFGTNGEVYLEDKNCGIINVAYADGNAEQVGFTPERGYFNELLNFYNSLQGSEQISVTPEMEYGDVKMVFDILKSIEKKKVIYVDEPQPKEYMEISEGEESRRPYIQ